ncbi:MAG: hypothetical protein AAF740_04795 [Bacteroidota bacterium]
MKRRKELLLLIFLFALESFFLFDSLGVKYVNDSHRYLAYAEALESGFYTEAHNIWYLGYVGFIYGVRLFSESFFVLVVAQYVYSAAGLVFLYLTIERLHPKGYAALIGGFLYLILIEICTWNAYILCESVYFNNLVMAFYLLVRCNSGVFTNDLKRLGLILPTSMAILLAALTKPTGVALVLTLGVCFGVKFWKSIKTPIIVKYISLTFISTLFLFLTNRMLTTFSLVENYQTGEVVYDITNPENHQTLNAHPYLVNSIPEDIEVLPDSYPPLIRTGHFIIMNFWFWAGLFTEKVMYFVLHIRPYWSLKHIAFNLFTILPIYFFTFRYLRQTSFPVRLFVLTYFLTHILIVGMTTVDWDGRFFVPLLPVLIVCAAQGTEIIRERVKLSFISKK